MAGKRLKSSTSPPDRLTSKQFDLLVHILFKSYEKQGNEHPVTWSPKAFLGRSPTKVEAAALSRRLSTLVDHGLLGKAGRLVITTPTAKTLIRAHISKHDNRELFHNVLLLLELSEIFEHQKAVKTTMHLAQEWGRAELLTKEGLPSLYLDVLGRLDALIKRLQGGGQENTDSE